MTNNSIQEVSLEEAATVDGGVIDLLIAYAMIRLMTSQTKSAEPEIIFHATASPSCMGDGC